MNATSRDINTTNILIFPSGWHWPMVCNWILVMMVGVSSNILTLLALPYVRIRYGAEFSILQTSSALLLFHLSLCDLLYCLIYLPPLILVYTLQRIPISENVCLFLGVFRSMVAYADFITIALIAVCVCKHKLCKICRESGDISSHNIHDGVFGGAKIMAVILFIWLFSCICMLTDMFNIGDAVFLTKESSWSCNSVFTSLDGVEQRGLVGLCVLVILLIIILVSYSIIVRQVLKDKKEAEKLFLTSQLEQQRKLTIHIIGIGVLLSIAYLIFIFPEIIASRLMTFKVLPENMEVRAGLAGLHWWLYGTNFILYITTSRRLRQAYGRFLRDLRQGNMSEGESKKETQSSTSSKWWSEMKVST